MDEVGREEHEEFKQRMEDEHKRINRRLQELETVTKQITDLALSVQKLATSIENMVQAQNRQEERLSELVCRAGEMLRQIITCTITALIGGAVGWLLRNAGIM